MLDKVRQSRCQINGKGAVKAGALCAFVLATIIMLRTLF